MNLLNNGTRLGTVIVLAWALFYLRAIYDIPVEDSVFSDRTLPTGLCIAIIICGVLRLALPVDAAEEPELSKVIGGFHWQPAAGLVGLMFLYALAFSYLGFLISSILFLLSGFAVLGHRGWLVALSVSVGLAFGIWLLLTQAFGLYLDPGWLYHKFFGAG